MAIYHIDIKAHSRSLNVHAIALSSYRSGEKLRCDADGKIRNCRSGTKSAVEFTALLNNRDLSRERLWNKAEAMERRKDAVVAREIELGLPCELSLQEHKELSMAMGQKIAERYNCAVDLAVHAPDLEGDERNWHVHLLFTSRSWAETDKRNREFSSKKYRDLNKANAKEEVLFWRELWEGMVNKAYEQKDMEERVSSKSCEAQGKLKKYEHFDFNKYQLLRRNGELDDAKKASRLGIEITRDELEIEDLMEIKAELLRERERVLNSQLKKEKSYVGLGKENGRSGTGEPDHTTAEFRHSKPVKEIGTGAGSFENSPRSTRATFTIGGDNDQGFRGMEASAGSTGNEQVIGLGGKAWKGIKQTAKRLWEFMFKGDLLKKLLLFKEKKELKEAKGLIDFTGIQKTKTQVFIESLDLREYKAADVRANLNYFREHIGDEYKIEQYEKVRLELRDKIFKRQDFSLEYSLLKLFDLEVIEKQKKKSKSSSWKDKWSTREVREINTEVRRLERDFRKEFFPFKRAQVKADLKTIVIAREVTRNFFGSIKSTRDVIIDFNKHYALHNLKESASLSSIEEIKELGSASGLGQMEDNIRYLQKDRKAKSGWKVFEIEINDDQSLEEVLKKECNGFEMDKALLERLEQFHQQRVQQFNEAIVDLKSKGLWKWRPKISIDSMSPKLSDDNEYKYNRGIGI